MGLNNAALADELGNASWNDPRLRDRLRTIVERLSENPELSFPGTFTSEAELEGAYRFFNNPVVTLDSILHGHFEATRQRCLEEERVLVVHDTTKFQFRKDGKRVGLGKDRSGQNFYAHMALVIADDGTRRVLGVSGIHTWPFRKKGTEQARWENMVDIASARLGGAKRVHVMDREGDDYALFAHLVNHGEHFVIRACHDRLLDDDAGKLKGALARVTLHAEREVDISGRVSSNIPKRDRIYPARRSRKASLTIGATQVNIAAPKPHPRNSKSKRRTALPPNLSLNVVYVLESNPPPNEPAVEWILWTTEPIDTPTDILRVVDQYRNRWVIEEFFKAIKTGCAYETRQLRDYESLVNALAVFAPIACSLLTLRAEAHHEPDTPTKVISPDEIQVLRAMGRILLPSTPTARQVMLAIAALGGHIKRNGNPGWITLLRGYVKLVTLTQGWMAAKLQPSSDQS